ncbi:galactosylceramide sulfotransferase-like [Amphiura filiformis]|uniref:galactosylceramide sulfotransferase-like n=1 Tax=Amphiura filiformis TaxID=82378 RepID=UPI003B210DD2
MCLQQHYMPSTTYMYKSSCCILPSRQEAEVALFSCSALNMDRAQLDRPFAARPTRNLLWSPHTQKIIKNGFPKTLIICCIIYLLYAYFLTADIQRMRIPQPKSASGVLRKNTTDWLEQQHTQHAQPIQARCVPSEQVVFIKTHKTGSTTLQTIIHRFGFFRNSSFVFNKNSSQNGHFYFLPVNAEESPQTFFLPPINVSDGDYGKYTNYDMLTIHVRYNRTAMDKFMKTSTKYISILREPSTQWESSFDQFLFQEAISNISKIPKTQWIEHFLKKPDYYRNKLHKMKYEKVMGRRWYYSQNSQSYDLGLEAHSFYNESAINKTIDSLTKEFDLILIMEYFDESLLLLKQELCWGYEDIVYLPKNFRRARRNLSDELRQKIRAWNHADVLLYRHFNQTLWRRIKEYGPNFEEHLKHFRELNQNIFNECSDKNVIIESRGKRIIKYGDFEAKQNASLFCHTVAENKKVLFDRVYDRQNCTSTRIMT